MAGAGERQATSRRLRVWSRDQARSGGPRHDSAAAGLWDRSREITHMGETPLGAFSVVGSGMPACRRVGPMPALVAKDGADCRERRT